MWVLPLCFWGKAKLGKHEIGPKHGRWKIEQLGCYIKITLKSSSEPVIVKSQPLSWRTALQPWLDTGNLCNGAKSLCSVPLITFWVQSWLWCWQIWTSNKKGKIQNCLNCRGFLNKFVIRPSNGLFSVFFTVFFKMPTKSQTIILEGKPQICEHL